MVSFINQQFECKTETEKNMNKLIKILPPGKYGFGSHIGSLAFLINYFDTGYKRTHHIINKNAKLCAQIL